jgi:Kazal-type serine protease inhibitor domain
VSSYFAKAAHRSLFGQNPQHNLWLFLTSSNATREATVKSGIVISFAAALALLISFSSGANAVGVGKQCDGFVIHPQFCNHGLFCQRQAGQCFIADISGTCARIPRFCPHIFLPVCGCDGKTYPNDCERLRAKVSKNHDGKCFFN